MSICRADQCDGVLCGGEAGDRCERLVGEHNRRAGHQWIGSVQLDGLQAEVVVFDGVFVLFVQKKRKKRGEKRLPMCTLMTVEMADR